MAYIYDKIMHEVIIMQNFFLTRAEKGLNNRKISSFLISFLVMFVLTVSITAMIFFSVSTLGGLFLGGLDDSKNIIFSVVISICISAVILYFTYRRVKKSIKEQRLNYIKQLLVATYLLVIDLGLIALRIFRYDFNNNLAFYISLAGISVSFVLVTILSYIEHNSLLLFERVRTLIDDKLFQKRIESLNESNGFVADSSEISKEFIIDIDIGIYTVRNKDDIQKLEQGKKVDVFIPSHVLEAYKELKSKK